MSGLQRAAEIYRREMAAARARRVGADVSDDGLPCSCGEPSTRNVVHRSDGPCYVPVLKDGRDELDDVLDEVEAFVRGNLPDDVDPQQIMHELVRALPAMMSGGVSPRGVFITTAALAAKMAAGITDDDDTPAVEG